MVSGVIWSVRPIYGTTIKSLDKGLQGAFELVNHGGSGYMAHPEACGNSSPSLSPCSSVRLFGGVSLLVTQCVLEFVI